MTEGYNQGGWGEEIAIGTREDDKVCISLLNF